MVGWWVLWLVDGVMWSVDGVMWLVDGVMWLVDGVRWFSLTASNSIDGRSFVIAVFLLLILVIKLCEESSAQWKTFLKERHNDSDQLILFHHLIILPLYHLFNLQDNLLSFHPISFFIPSFILPFIFHSSTLTSPFSRLSAQISLTWLLARLKAFE